MLCQLCRENCFEVIVWVQLVTMVAACSIVLLKSVSFTLNNKVIDFKYVAIFNTTLQFSVLHIKTLTYGIIKACNKLWPLVTIKN